MSEQGRPVTPDDAAQARDLRVRYQELFEFAPDAQLVTNVLGVIAEANFAAADLFRVPKEFLIDKPLGLLVSPSHRGEFYGVLRRMTRPDLSEGFGTRVNRRNESPREVEALARTHDVGGLIVLRWLFRDETERRRAEASRVDLMRRLSTAQEDERKRISREMHDTVGQLLTGLTLAARAARVLTPLSEPVSDQLDVVERLADELGRAVHDLAARLRPTSLDDLGLDAALSQHLREWSKHTGIESDFQSVGLDAGARLPDDVETAIYRVAQEALTNAARHSQAKRVAVALESHGGRAILVVEDDGVGFDPEADTGRLGLLGMRERAALAGGSLHIESSPGNGTSVIARFALKQIETPETEGTRWP